MKKILLFTCFWLFAVFVSAQRTLNWKISFESKILTAATEIKVTVNKTDTCSYIESIFSHLNYIPKQLKILEMYTRL